MAAWKNVLIARMRADLIAVLMLPPQLSPQPGKATGVFYGCGDIEDLKKPEKKFEYVIIVILDDDLNLVKICCLCGNNLV